MSDRYTRLLACTFGAAVVVEILAVVVAANSEGAIKRSPFCWPLVWGSC